MATTDFTILRHAVPSVDGLSPLQNRMISDGAAVRIFSAPTGAGKSYAFQFAMRKFRSRVLFIVPTRRLAQNIGIGLRADLARHGYDEGEIERSVSIWTSDERFKLLEDNPDLDVRSIRLGQIREETSKLGKMIIATPESVAQFLLNPRLRNDGQDMESIFDILRLDHVVFDEFHTIEARGMGIACAVARLASEVSNCRTTFLSATPIEIATQLIHFGIPEETIAIANETIVTGPKADTAGMRAIHGDVHVSVVHDAVILQILEEKREIIRETLNRSDGSDQVVLIYDSIRRLQQDRPALAAYFDSMGIDRSERLAISSFDDSTDRHSGYDFMSGREYDPVDFKVLVATSSVEMGVTFKAGLIVMEPGHDLCSFVQRIGRVARGDIPGTVLVSSLGNSKRTPDWLNSGLLRVRKLGPEISVDELTAELLSGSSKRFKVSKANLDDERPQYRRMSQTAAWCAGLFWVAMENVQIQKGRRLTLRNFSPKQATVIGAKISELKSLDLVFAKNWADAFLKEAKRLRMIEPKVRIIDHNGEERNLSWSVFASTEELSNAPAVINDHGNIEVRLDIPMSAIDWRRSERFAKREVSALLPHLGTTVSGPVDRIGDMVRQRLANVGATSSRKNEIRAAEVAASLIRLTGIIPEVDNGEAPDVGHLIM